jgi:hypothetical protein
MSLAETTVRTMSDDRSPEDRVADLVGLLNVVTAELAGSCVPIGALGGERTHRDVRARVG